MIRPGVLRLGGSYEVARIEEDGSSTLGYLRDVNGRVEFVEGAYFDNRTWNRDAPPEHELDDLERQEPDPDAP